MDSREEAIGAKIAHNPVNGMIYGDISIDKKDGSVFYNTPILNHILKAQLKQQYIEGKITQDKATYGGYTKEYEAKMPEYVSAVMKASEDGRFNYKKAGLGTNIAFTSLDKVVVLNEVLNVQFRIFQLPDAIRKIATPDTTIRVDVATTFNAAQAVGEMQSVDPNRQTYTRNTLVLPKDVAFFGLTDEAQYRFSHPLFQLHVDNTARALRAAWNAQIATVMEGGTTLGGSNWDTVSSGLSSNNPLVDIESGQTTIVGNGGQPYTIAMHPKVHAGLISNTFIKGAYNANQRPIDSMARQTDLTDKVAKLTIFVDAGLTNTKATLYDFNQYLVCGDGPTIAFQWRDYGKDADMYKIEHYHLEQRQVAGKGRVLTSVHS